MSTATEAEATTVLCALSARLSILVHDPALFRAAAAPYRRLSDIADVGQPRLVLPAASATVDGHSCMKLGVGRTDHVPQNTPPCRRLGGALHADSRAAEGVVASVRRTADRAETTTARSAKCALLSWT